MGESLNQPCRVQDDGPTGCKLLLYRKKLLYVYRTDGTIRISTANSVPAAAVIRRVQALSGFIGFKGCAGGMISQWCNPTAQL